MTHPVYIGAALRQAAAYRAELELERSRRSRLENRVRDLNEQLVRAGAFELKANAYREDLEQEMKTGVDLRFQVTTLRDELEQARAISATLRASAAEQEFAHAGVATGWFDR